MTNELANTHQSEAYECLSLALRPFFGQPLHALPADLGARAKEAVCPHRWDELTPKGRESLVYLHDRNRDPAYAAERDFWWAFADRKKELETQIATWQATPAPTASDLALKETRLAELRQVLAQMVKQGDVRGERPYVPGVGAVIAPDSDLASFPPVTADLIRQHFQVVANADKSDAWWREVMSNAKRTSLSKCRARAVSKNPADGRLWYPHLIAAWLTDRDKRGDTGLSLIAVRRALRKFPGYEYVADEMFPADD